MRRRLAPTVLSIGALASTPVHGATGHSATSTNRDATGVSLGLRLGWGLPLGDRVRLLLVNQPMGPGGDFSGLVPIWFDAGYRVSKLLYLGGYFQYGFLLVPSGTGCPMPLVGCHAHDIRGGANVQFHFLTERSIGPWLGAGFGYETSSITFEGSEQTSTRSNGGFEFMNLQAGVDVRSSSGIDWGPFVSFSFDEYLTETQTLPDGSSKTYSLSGPNSQPTLHYFAIIGMRGQLEL